MREMQVTPALVSWKDITFTVQEKKKGSGVAEKVILDSVSGSAMHSFSAVELHHPLLQI